MDYDYSMVDSRYNHSSLLGQARASASDDLLLNHFDGNVGSSESENNNWNISSKQGIDGDNDAEWLRNQRRRICQFGKSSYLPFGEVETGVKRQRENRIEIEMESKRQKTRESSKNDFMNTKAVIAAATTTTSASSVGQQNESESTAIIPYAVNSEIDMVGKDLSNLMIIPFSNRDGLSSSSLNSGDELPMASSSDTWIATPWGQIVTSQALKNTMMKSSRFEQRCLRDRTAAPMSSALVLWKGNDSNLIPSTTCSSSSSSNSIKCPNVIRTNYQSSDSPSNSPNTAVIPYSWDQNRVEIELLPDDDDVTMINGTSSTNMDID